LAQTRTTELKGAEEKISRVSGVRSKSRRTYKGFVRKGTKSRNTKSGTPQTNSLDRFVYSTSHDCLAKINARFDSYCKESEEP
jgi:hypothetical protein